MNGFEHLVRLCSGDATVAEEEVDQVLGRRDDSEKENVREETTTHVMKSERANTD